MWCKAWWRTYDALGHVIFVGVLVRSDILNKNLVESTTKPDMGCHWVF